jgi:hypothetical protein
MVYHLVASQDVASSSVEFVPFELLDKLCVHDITHCHNTEDLTSHFSVRSSLPFTVLGVDGLL